ncbi:outer membrane protein transport protein [Flavivirga eckloniae]|uniref:Aromatic hydrocarbon degradation protein n=1 Tax=Flavivirga eckloniae TaxID=1803846 RepID=A0A2K9PNE9_9FLAO|nr:outer membrane protein transport protein [Flavivirga eckloniae]AUP78591.1 hypothetical protein C1H87_07645 [Flavivirga eckloniae]
MIKKLVLVFVAVFAIHSYGQEGTASPYSFYGIGSLKFKGTVENRSMGGISVFNDSIHINLRNPASFAGKNMEVFNNEARPVKFTVGGSHSSISLKSDSGTDQTSSTTFDYLALSIPMGKFGFGFGLLPYTSVGYKLEASNDNGEVESRFRGEGGLNKAFLGLGYQITDGLSIGVDAHYNFGNIQNSAILFSFDSDGQPLQNYSQENNRSDLSGLNFNLGLTYRRMLTDKLQLSSAVTYTPESKIVSKNQRSISTINSGTNRGSTINVDLEADGLLETDLTLPSKFSIGAGIGKPRSWFVGAEYTSQKMSNFSNELYTNSAVSQVYEDASTFSLGGFYIPQYDSYTSYLKRTVFRAGLRYEKTGLNIENESINEFGISFGVGLPVGNFLSNANLGVEVGRRGTTNNGLIQENFVNFQISLSLNDRWFQKRKYD